MCLIIFISFLSFCFPITFSKTFGGDNSDNGQSVQQTTDGGYIIAGWTESFGDTLGDVYLVKTDGQGNVTSTFNIPIPNANRKLQVNN